MWVKICGITSVEDARIAAEAGADAIGLVFAESPRRVALEEAYKIVQQAPKAVEKIGVFVDAGFEEILSAVKYARLTGVQLHGDESGELAQRICERAALVGLQLRVVRVIRCGTNAVRLGFDLRLPETGGQQTFLVDSRVEGKHGGTGVAFDWRAAREMFQGANANCRLVVAGGLTPQNVGKAIAILRPWGVDVSSGVESAPGRKDSQRVIEFVRAARAVSAQMPSGTVGS